MLHFANALMDRVKQKLTNCKLNATLFSDDKMGDLENSPLGAVHILRNTIWEWNVDILHARYVNLLEKI